MIRLEMKPTARLVQQIAALERFAGTWDRLAASEAIASEELASSALQIGALEAMRLDLTSPPGLNFLLEKEWLSDTSVSPKWQLQGPIPGQLTSYIEAHKSSAENENTEFDLENIIETYKKIVSSDNSSIFRTVGFNFFAAGSDHKEGELVFPTVSPFLVEQRLSELIDWTASELETAAFHPLFIIGIFHLLFLQIHPFSEANHRLSLLLCWRLLDAQDYGFVRYGHFAPVFSSRAKQYYSALRQAEKTALTTWSTLNIWLEFFLDALLSASETLLKRSEKHVSNARLTKVQQRIIDVVRANGSVSRERIVSETGINLSTVKYNLSVLASRGHLKRLGGGRTTSYCLL